MDSQCYQCQCCQLTEESLRSSRGNSGSDQTPLGPDVEGGHFTETETVNTTLKLLPFVGNY